MKGVRGEKIVINRGEMKVNFYLRNGSADMSSVQVVVTQNNKLFRRQTGFSIKTSRWKKPKSGAQTSSEPKIAERLKEIRLNLEARLSELSTPDEIDLALDEVIGIDKGKRKVKRSASITFWEYFKEYSERERPHVKNYTNIYRKVKEMTGGNEDWDDIDGAWYFRLMREMEGRGYALNYQGTFIKIIKSVMNEAFTLKFHNNTSYRNFKKPQEVADSVYLTEKEVDAIWHLDNLPSIEAKARDLFIIGIYTAARYSDYSRLSMEDIHDGFIRFIQKKTFGDVIIPASPRVLSVMKRNGGRAPKLSMQKLNANIKHVCRKAGITDEMLITKSKGAKHITKRIEKCELVSSHTARRTGATLLYMSGVPLKQCMMITGHTTEANFMRYIRTRKEENAELLAHNPFFTKE